MLGNPHLSICPLPHRMSEILPAIPWWYPYAVPQNRASAKIHHPATCADLPAGQLWRPALSGPAQAWLQPSWSKEAKRSVSLIYYKWHSYRVRLNFGSKPSVWSFLHHPQGTGRIKYDPFPAHHFLQSRVKIWQSCGQNILIFPHSSSTGWHTVREMKLLEFLPDLLHPFPAHVCPITPGPHLWGNWGTRGSHAGWEPCTSSCSCAMAGPVEHILQGWFSRSKLTTICVFSFFKHDHSISKNRPIAFISPTNIHL